jgi:hypothetical protein
MSKDEIDEKFPELYQFLVGCFGEDWYDDATRPEERLVGGPQHEPDVYKRNIRAFVSNLSDCGYLTLDQLDTLLAHSLPVEELAEVLTVGFHVNYWPGSNAGYRPWLEEVRATLAACLNQQT